MDKIKAAFPVIQRRLILALVVIMIGVTLRLTGYEIGLPYFLVKYGGSLLWGGMLLWVVGVLLPYQPLSRLLLLAAVIAVVVEFSRLYHTPWLDEFRLTLAGALLLGRIFSWWNILAYLLGILVGAMIESRLLAREGKADNQR